MHRKQQYCSFFRVTLHYSPFYFSSKEVSMVSIKLISPSLSLLLSTGDISGVVSVSCGHIEWAPATVAGCSDEGLTYRIRIYSGTSFEDTDESQKVVLSSTTNSLTFSLTQVPSTRPLRAIVSSSSEPVTLYIDYFFLFQVQNCQTNVSPLTGKIKERQWCLFKKLVTPCNYMQLIT